VTTAAYLRLPQRVPLRGKKMRPPDHSEGPTHAEHLARKKLEEAASVPGPGSYAAYRSEFEKAEKPHAQPFCTTASRFSNKLNPTMGDLGPGAYSDGMMAVTNSINVKERHPASLHTTPFGCTAGRFGKQSVVGQALVGATPGPGSYTKEETGFIAAQHDRQFGRFEGGFGSAVDRFNQVGQPNSSAEVGPGAYEVGPEPQMAAALAKRRHKGGVSSMDSTISREKGISISLGVVNASAEPAPGDYQVEKGLGSMGPPGREDIPQVHETPFGITVKRWKDGKSKSIANSQTTPGPGQYDDDKANLALPARDREGKPIEGVVSFTTSAERFAKRAPGEGRRTKVPGPGEYTDGVKAATVKWRTPTFNVSIKRTEAMAKQVEVL